MSPASAETVQHRVIVVGSHSPAAERALERGRLLDPEASSVANLAELEERIRVVHPDIVLVAEPLSDEEMSRLNRIFRAAGASPEIWVVTPMHTFTRQSKLLRVGELELDSKARKVTFRGQPLEFRAKLVQLLELLCERGEAGASYDDIIETINRGYGERNLVHEDVSQLRRGLGEASQMLWTKRGFGYVLSPTCPPHFGPSRGSNGTATKLSARSGTRRRTRRK